MASSLRYGVEVRSAQAADAPELARLLAQAGFPSTPAAAADRLDAMRARPDCAVLVATGWTGLSGMVALHWAPTLGHPRPVAHITTLVVDADERRHGIGRMLLKAASQAARVAGCDVMELVSGAGEAFCRATGFTEGTAVFTRSLRRRSE
jgi:N-acetylglutamate synthase-like GNAT family acetyltransferase